MSSLFRGPVRGIATVALSTLLAACSGQFWVNTLTPRWGYDRHADIAYGELARQRLDIYVPAAKALGAPVVVFFYGGSWQEGDKAGYRFVGQALASRGYTVVIPDYRLYPPTTFPGFVEDAAAALAWARATADDYGANGERLFVAGHSAGAHIAALLATDARYLEAEGLSPAAISGLVGLAGPYDFLPIKDPVLQEIFAPRSQWPQTQPITFVDGNEPPMLLLHGGDDETVYPKNSRNLAEKVAATGGAAELKIYPGVGHIGIIAPLAAPLRFTGSELDDIDDFLRRRLADGA